MSKEFTFKRDWKGDRVTRLECWNSSGSPSAVYEAKGFMVYGRAGDMEEFRKPKNKLQPLIADLLSGASQEVIQQKYYANSNFQVNIEDRH